MITKGLAGITAGVVLIAGAAQANEFEPALRALAEETIKEVVADPALVAAIRAQNEKHAGMDEAAILELDQQWRGEVGAGATPTIDPVLTGAVADMLRAVRDDSAGLFTEIFVMDAVGLNVAASDVTSDYWQGDEAKWADTFQVGANAVHVSEVEMDESTQTFQAQVSVAVTDQAGSPVGAATFGVNIDLLP